MAQDINIGFDIVSDMFGTFGPRRPRGFPLPPRGALKFVILKMLEEKPRTGAEMMDEVESMSLGHWRPSPGSVYPMLSYLEEKGYVSGKIEGTAKRYSLEPKGKEFLDSGRKLLTSGPLSGAGVQLLMPPWLDLGLGQNGLLMSFRKLSMELLRVRKMVRSGEAPKELEDKATGAIQSALEEVDALLEKYRRSK